MQILESHIDTSGSTFKANRDRMQQLVAELRTRIATAREGGGAKYVARHRAQGKMPVRELVQRRLRDQAAHRHATAVAAMKLKALEQACIRQPLQSPLRGAQRAVGIEPTV